MTLLRAHPKIGLVYTGHRRTLAKLSNIILIGLTDQGKDWGNKRLQIDCSFEDKLILKTSLK